MARIGILGGTFNPIHLGHLLIGRAAAEAFALDRVLLLPCCVSPFKIGASDLAPDADRLAMVRLSIQGDPLFEASTLDLDRGGVSYAIDTVRALRARCPDDRFAFIIGMDALCGLSHWRQAGAMLDLCEVITVERPGLDVRELPEETLSFPREVRDRLLANVIRGPLFDVSASEIRRRIAEGRTIRYLVCPEVEAYIRTRGLYRTAKEK
ncbi:MAG: nicotinate-nucleotide adenylyltransferase [Kiritimatiellia bacterium]|jgi:nicotinate-nucleotide adenylyltransferase|nr:nicotinate-nucleotide adenylyltransferase [Kiritimatiellia bacterium]